MLLELLIVSAQTAVRQQIERILSTPAALPAPVQWSTVHSLPTVQRHISANRPDVVLLDLALPGCEDAEAVTAVCQQTHPGIVIALTPAGRPETGIQAMQSGAALYLDSACINVGSFTQALQFVLLSPNTRETSAPETDVTFKPAQTHEQPQQVHGQIPAEFYEEQFQQLFESAPNAFVIVDKSGQIVLGNRRAERLFGYSQEELIGMTVESLIPASFASEHRQQRKAYFKEPFAREMGIGMDMFALRKNRIEVPVEIGLSPISTSEGLMVLAAVIDITRRKATQAEIRERVRQQSAVAAIGQLALEGGDLSTLMQTAAERVATTLNVTYTAVWQLNAEQNALLLCAGQGWSQSQVGEATIPHLSTTATGQALRTNRSLIWKNINTEMRFSLSGFLKEQNLVSGLVSVIGGRDQAFGVLAAYTPHQRSFSKNDAKFLEAVSNVLGAATARTQIEDENAQLYQKSQELSDRLEDQVEERTRQLQEVNEELEAFAYTVSHDLRAPLRAMDGFSRILLEDFAADMPQEAAFYMKRIRHNAQQMAELINDLLRFSRLSREPLQKITVEPTHQVRQVLQDLQAEEDDRQIDVTLEELPSCAADVRLLRQVWANLLDNALKYTRDKDIAKIRVGSYKENGEVVYFVEDNGAGFNMAYVDKLFGVFQRLHRAEEYEGTGVGLAIVQRIVHRHNGRIWADSVEAEGATFFFTLGIEEKEREETRSG